MAQPIVAIVGAKALRRDLNRLVDDVRSPLFRAMAAAGREAVTPVVGATINSLRAHEGSRASGTRLEGTIRAYGTRTGAGVRMGTKNIPYAGWIEFGGTRRHPHESHREFKRGGRYLFPAGFEYAPGAADSYSKALTRLFGSAGIWTNVTDNPEAVHD